MDWILPYVLGIATGLVVATVFAIARPKPPTKR